MKIRIKALKRIIRESLLVETPCPACGDPNAYVGVTDVECPNPDCRKPHGFFTQRQHDDVHAQEKANRMPNPRSKKYFIEMFPWSCDRGERDQYEKSARKHGIEFEYFTHDMSPYGGPSDEGGFKISGTKERLRRWLIDNGFQDNSVDGAQEYTSDPAGTHAYKMINTM